MEFKRPRARKWEKKWVKVAHMMLYKWVPVEPLDKHAIEMWKAKQKEKAEAQRIQIAEDAPVTRSASAAYRSSRPQRNIKRPRYKEVNTDDEDEDEDEEDGRDDTRSNMDDESRGGSVSKTNLAENIGQPFGDGVGIPQLNEDRDNKRRRVDGDSLL